MQIKIQGLGCALPWPVPPSPHRPMPCHTAAGSVPSQCSGSSSWSRMCCPSGPGQEPQLPTPAGLCWNQSPGPVVQNPTQHRPMTRWHGDAELLPAGHMLHRRSSGGGPLLFYSSVWLQGHPAKVWDHSRAGPG